MQPYKSPLPELMLWKMSQININLATCFVKPHNHTVWNNGN